MKHKIQCVFFSRKNIFATIDTLCKKHTTPIVSDVNSQSNAGYWNLIWSEHLVFDCERTNERREKLYCSHTRTDHNNNRNSLLVGQWRKFHSHEYKTLRSSTSVPVIHVHSNKNQQQHQLHRHHNKTIVSPTKKKLAAITLNAKLYTSHKTIKLILFCSDETRREKKRRKKHITH